MPDGPAIVLANEFFDALPVNQAIKQFNGWYERVVEIDPDGNLAFGIANELIPLFDQLVPPSMRDAPIGAIYEWRADNLPLVAQPAAGASGRRGAGDRLRPRRERGRRHLAGGRRARLRRSAAVARRGRSDRPRRFPGACARGRKHGRARVRARSSRREFLRNLGIEKRAATLKALASPEKAAEIDSAIKRLLGEGRTEMGKLFKAIGIAHPSLGSLPGFEPDAV